VPFLLLGGSCHVQLSDACRRSTLVSLQQVWTVVIVAEKFPVLLLGINVVLEFCLGRDGLFELSSIVNSPSCSHVLQMEIFVFDLLDHQLASVKPNRISVNIRQLVESLRREPCSSAVLSQVRIVVLLQLRDQLHPVGMQLGYLCHGVGL
jgi:hypothetical protein